MLSINGILFSSYNLHVVLSHSLVYQMLFLLLFHFYFLSFLPPIIAVNRNIMTLYDPSGFVGGRAGNPQCDDILGRPHKSSCECAMRAMEWTRISARRRRITTYRTASAIFTADLLRDETPSQPLRGELPFRWPRLALPRQYTCGTFATISLGFGI